MLSMSADIDSMIKNTGNPAALANQRV